MGILLSLATDYRYTWVEEHFQQWPTRMIGFLECGKLPMLPFPTSRSGRFVVYISVFSVNPCTLRSNGNSSNSQVYSNTYDAHVFFVNIPVNSTQMTWPKISQIQNTLQKRDVFASFFVFCVFRCLGSPWKSPTQSFNFSQLLSKTWFLGMGKLPYISHIHTAYIGKYLHFRYLKCFATVGCLTFDCKMTISTDLTTWNHQLFVHHFGDTKGFQKKCFIQKGEVKPMKSNQPKRRWTNETIIFKGKFLEVDSISSVKCWGLPPLGLNLVGTDIFTQQKHLLRLPPGMLVNDILPI